MNIASRLDLLNKIANAKNYEDRELHIKMLRDYDVYCYYSEKELK